MKSTNCPFRHVRGDKTIVCKHWLRGLCKKGDGCEFLHEYDMSKMPECYFYSRFNACHNKECPFLHIDPGGACARRGTNASSSTSTTCPRCRSAISTQDSM